jgi:hypothetical protein
MTTTGVMWGDVGTWVGSIGTVLAFAVTFWLLLLTRREQSSLRAEQRQAQARLASAWFESIEDGRGGRDRVTVVLDNASDEPIYFPAVAVGERWVSWGKSEIPYEEVPQDDIPNVIPPRYQERYRVEIHLYREPSGDGERHPPVEMQFVDASGRTWFRDRSGELREISKGSDPRDHFFRVRPNRGGTL